MKKLSQTWKQRRPKREMLTKSNFKEKYVENQSSNKYIQEFDANEEKEKESLDFNMDSLNFESQIEMLGDMKTEIQQNNNFCQDMNHKSPVLRDLQQCVGRRETMPLDTKIKDTYGLANNTMKEKKTFNVGEKMHIEEKKSVSNSSIDRKMDLEISSQNKFTKCIDSWGLPKCVVDKYNRVGISEIFEWQRDCLLTGKSIDGGNLVYSAPTSAGKTLVAEILMLKRVLSTKRKAIYILPFVSVAREKMFYLQDLFKEAGIRVDGYMGSQAPSGGFASTDIAVCTIEKANSLVNRLMEERKMNILGVVVIDEMHMIGDGQRGYLLELMLSKIRFLQECENSEDGHTASGVQVVGMSATLPNLNMLATWLNADLYVTDYRPVPLVETIKVGRIIFDQDMQKVSEINSDDVVNGDEDHVIPLCLETIRDCHSVLIFCPTKQWCEKLAKTIADNLKRLLDKNNTKETDHAKSKDLMKDIRTRFLDATAIAEVLEQLRRSPVGLDKALADVVSSGVSFHHAGLTFDERDVIEGAFRRGAVRVLVATSTLSSGVNLPARRVILRTPIFHGKLVNSLVYKQMTGRAGRKGVDTKGESILICKPNEKEKGIKLLKSHLEPVYSCLMGMADEDGIPGMKRALLEIIAAGVATTRADVKRYANCLYLKTCLAMKTNFDPSQAIQNTIQYLIDNEFVRVKNDKKQEEGDEPVAVDQSETFSPTQLGSATLASALSPDEALVVFRELQKARRCFVLENELHLVYEVMPIYLQSQLPQLDWYHYFSLFDKLPPQYKRVGEIVGVEEGFLARAVRGRIPTKTGEQRRKLAVHQRFYSALALLELVNEIPLRTVSRRYNINKGLLQSLQSSASTFAGMVTKFCEKLGWRSLEMLIDQFQSRLSFGVTRELCDLVRISLLNGARARLLYNSGYHTVSAVAMASTSELTKLLENFAPFESSKNLQGECERELTSKKRVRSFWVTGKDGMTEAEAARLMVDEAKELVKKDLLNLGMDVNNIRFLDEHKNETNVEGNELNVEGDVDNTGKDVLQVDQIAGKRESKRKLDDIPELNGILKRRSPARNIEGEARHSLNKGNCTRSNLLEVDDKIYGEEKKENVVPEEIKVTCYDQSFMDSKPIPRLSNKSQKKTKAVDRNYDVRVTRSQSVKKKEREVSGKSQALSIKEHFENGAIVEDDVMDMIKNDNKDSVDDQRKNIECNSNNKFQVSKLHPTEHAIEHSEKETEISGKYIGYENGVNIGLTDLVKNAGKNSSTECSFEEENVSLILIDSNEGILDESDDKKNRTAELFSETFWDDVEIVATAKQSPEVLNTKLNAEGCVMPETDALRGITQGEGRVFYNKTCSSRKDEKPDKERVEMMKMENRVTEAELKKSLIDECDDVACDDVDLEYDSSTSIIGGSFERCNYSLTENQSDDSFKLGLSESIELSSPEILDKYKVNDDRRTDGDSVGKSKCGKENTVSSEDQHRFTKIKQRSQSYEGDSEIIISSNDSFAKALCDVVFQQSSPGVELFVKVKGEEAKDGCAVLVNTTDGVNGKYNESKVNCKVDKNGTATQRIETKGGKMEFDGGKYKVEPIERKVENKVEDKNKLESNHDGNKVFVEKRRSSERIAKRVLKIGHTSDKFIIVDVTCSQDVFETFLEEWKGSESFSFSVAREFQTAENMQKNPNSINDVSGIAVCLGGKTAYFVDFKQEGLLGDKFESFIKRTTVMITSECSTVNKVVFDTKEHFKVLSKSLNVELKGRLTDPKVAAWLLDPSSKEMTLQEMAKRHLPNECRDFMNKIGNSYDPGSIGLMTYTAASGRLRSGIEAVLALKLMSVLEMRLASEGLYRSFTEVEMPLVIILAKMEMDGFGFSTERCEKLEETLRGRMNKLESKARQFAKRPFSMNSHEDIAQLLFIELGLPPSGDPGTLITPKRGRQAKRSKHLSTAKGILEKLTALHPLPSLVLEWRKITNALTSVVYPMQRVKQFCKSRNMYRIHASCQFHTVTGRVIMTEPCLQHVPQDFDLEVQERKGSGAINKEHPVTFSTSEISERRGLNQGSYAKENTAALSSNRSRPVSMRSAFIPAEGSILIAADYSQLELRIITHLSQDRRLLSILNGDGDVFRMIAAETCQCPLAHVTDFQRQTAKHICYGIIYGIGPKALAEKLKVSEDEAVLFMKKFKNRFQGIQDFTRRTIEFARSKGYVTTLGGRKRYFTAINSTDAQTRSQAERQAVNTAVQGSAADLVKIAMINIDNRIANDLSKDNERSYGRSKLRKYAGHGLDSKEHLPKLVLQLHDELIYECYALDSKRFAGVLQTEMEQALKLAVRLPVKIKTGLSWGDMMDVL